MVKLNEDETYWVDENNNRWSKREYVEEQANLMSKSMIDCKNCSDCSNCKWCHDCFYCSNCSDCKDCTQCRFCYRCNDIQNCLRCSDSSLINDCLLCKDCHYSSFLSNCENLEDAHFCSNCKNFDSDPFRITIPFYDGVAPMQRVTVYWTTAGNVQVDALGKNMTLNEFIEFADNKYGDTCMKDIYKVVKYINDRI